MAHVYLRNDIYWAKIYQNGTPIYKSLGVKSKTSANRKASLLEEKLRNEALGISMGNNIYRLKDLFDIAKIISKTKKPNTQNIEKNVMGKFETYAGNIKLSDIDRIYMTEYINHLRYEKDLSGATCNIHFKALKVFFNYGVDEEMMLKDPTRKMKLLEANRRDRLVATDELELLLTELKDDILYPFIISASKTGGRIGELLNLKWRNLNFGEKEIWIVAEKNKCDRYVPMSDMIYDYFYPLKPSIKEQDEFVLKQFTKRYLQRRLRNFIKRFGIKGITFHVFRHTWITDLAREKCDPFTLQYLAGHEDITTTQKYIHLTHEDRKKAFKSMNKQTGSTDN